MILSPAQRKAAAISLTPWSPRIPRCRSFPVRSSSTPTDSHVVPPLLRHRPQQEIPEEPGRSRWKRATCSPSSKPAGLARYEVKSLIGGTVIEKHITLREFVSDEPGHLRHRRPLSVWVNVTVYARDLERIRIGQVATIGSGGHLRKAQREDRLRGSGGRRGDAHLHRGDRAAEPATRRRPRLFVAAHVGPGVQPHTVVAGQGDPNPALGRVVFCIAEDGDGFRAQAVESQADPTVGPRFDQTSNPAIGLWERTASF